MIVALSALAFFAWRDKSPQQPANGSQGISSLKKQTPNPQQVQVPVLQPSSRMLSHAPEGKLGVQKDSPNGKKEETNEKDQQPVAVSIPEGLPEDLVHDLTSPPPELPADFQAQLNVPPPPLPEDMERQLHSPPPPLPPDLQAQLKAKLPEIAEDMKQALESPPRIMTPEEANKQGPEG